MGLLLLVSCSIWFLAKFWLVECSQVHLLHYIWWKLAKYLNSLIPHLRTNWRALVQLFFHLSNLIVLLQCISIIFFSFIASGFKLQYYTSFLSIGNFIYILTLNAFWRRDTVQLFKSKCLLFLGYTRISGPKRLTLYNIVSSTLNTKELQH